jgi:hypothetical protein
MEQKQLHLEIARNMLENVSSDPSFLNTVITGDETQVYGYDPETKMQWKHPSSPRPKKSTAGPQQCQGHADRFL